MRFGYFAGIFAVMPLDPFKNLVLTPDLLRLVGEIDEFKGAWKALGTLAPDRLATLRHITTVESVGASTRIEGAKLTDREVDVLLSNLDLGSFRTRDEQEVAGYAEATKLVFDSWREIPLTENYIKQLHGTLLKFSPRDEHHRGAYKTIPNNVEAFDEHGRSIGVIFGRTGSWAEKPIIRFWLSPCSSFDFLPSTHFRTATAGMLGCSRTCSFFGPVISTFPIVRSSVWSKRIESSIIAR